MKKVAAVLGAGIQGCCAALALHKAGFEVRMYDKSHALFNRASLNQEGKLHLGFVYARDPSMVTARTMIAHSLEFAPAIEFLAGREIEWEPHLSNRFQCVVHRDSSLTLDEHARHFQALQDIYDELSSEQLHLHYLGRRPLKIWNEVLHFRFQSTDVVHAVQTEETAVHPGWLRQLLLSLIDEAGIEYHLMHTVSHAERAPHGFRFGGTNVFGEWKADADILVNCLWEGQQALDQSIGAPILPGALTRVKYGFLLQGDKSLSQCPSLIITHGPFGDIVWYPYDDTVYITWYPACLAYIGNERQLPAQWEAACEGRGDHDTANAIFHASVKELSEYLPVLKTLPRLATLAGTIMGHGKTDISDTESGLHKRHGIGVEDYDGYFSIFTGKFTSGPANAMQLYDML